ncbi:MAG: PadR family transcriptional regulator [Flavobacteriales bacterium]
MVKGSLYPALHKLSADGLIESEEEMIGKRVRVYYKLTTFGMERTQEIAIGIDRPLLLQCGRTNVSWDAF